MIFLSTAKWNDCKLEYKTIRASNQHSIAIFRWMQIYNTVYTLIKRIHHLIAYYHVLEYVLRVGVNVGKRIIYNEQ